MSNKILAISFVAEQKVQSKKQDKSVPSYASAFKTENKKVSDSHLKNNTASAIAQELADEIFGFGKAKLDKSIAKISSDNVFEVIEEYKKISDQKNSFFGKLVDDETLFEAILDESISKDKKKEYIHHIKTMMAQKIANNQGNTEVISEEFDKSLETVLKSSWPFQKPDELNNSANKFIEINNQINSLKNASKSEATSRGFHYVNIKAVELDKTYPDIFGDGKFNNNAKQMSGSCWIHGNVNAMIQTKKGREYLNNIIYKNHENGNISVYLKAAKDEGLPKGKKDGIFTFNEEEIANAAGLHSIGDGDYTALILAIDEFFKTTENPRDWRPGADYGGSDLHFYSLFFGKDVREKATVLIEPWRKVEDKDAKYNEIRKYFEEEQGVISVSLPPSREYIITDLDNEEGGFAAMLPEDHAYAIKKMTDKYVYLTDSNHPEKPVKVSKNTFVECFIAALWEL